MLYWLLLEAMQYSQIIFNKISDRLIFQGVGGICGIAVTVVVKSLILESDGMVYGLDMELNTYMQCEFHKLLTLPTFPYL